MVAQPPPIQKPHKSGPLGKVLLAVAGLIVIVLTIGTLMPDPDESPAGDQLRIAPTSTPIDKAIATIAPTATAIPRTGVQTILLSITVQDDWKAWGEGCVGDRGVDWATADAGVAVAQDDATGTVQGVKLGAGIVSPDGMQCQWSAKLTTRASDRYRIVVGGHNAYCHSNTMLPTDDGFFAAVMLNKDGVQCATVTDVSNTPWTPTPDSSPGA